MRLSLFSASYLVSLVIWVDSNGGVSEQGFQTSSSDDDALVGILDFISERSDGTEFELLLDVVSRNIQECLALQFLLVDLAVPKAIRGKQKISEQRFRGDSPPSLTRWC
jgi:hypothetical protein